MPAPPSTLDPTNASMSGATGGAALSAIYDTLVRWDPDAEEFVPQMAESIAANDDLTEWTLKLRPDVRFSDGTPVDAEAVIASMERHETPTADASTVIGMIDSMESPDEHTVVFSLSAPWSRFPNVFTSGGGMVVSPTALDELGDDFATAPVGAGPFVVERFDPASELVLKRNPDYWGGEPPLDGIRFTWSADQSVNLDKLTTGQIHLSFMNDTTAVNAAVNGGLPGYVTPVGGSGVLINTRAEGTDIPGDDPRFRQAVASAIDPDALNTRVSRGEGLYGAKLLPHGSPLAGDVPTATLDVEQAKHLVSEVKDDTGWNGKVTLLTPGQVTSASPASVIQAQLNAAGMDVEVEAVANYTDLVQKVVIDRNFELVIWQVSTYPEDPWDGIYRGLSSTSLRNYSGYEDPELDQLLSDLQAADGPEETVAAVEALSELWQEAQPTAIYGALPFSSFWAEGVHGLKPTAKALLLFDEAHLAP